MAGTYHFTFFARRSNEYAMTWKRDREPVPMGAGWTARMQCRDRPDGRLMTEWSTADGSIVLGATDGTIRLSKSAEDTEWVGWRHGVYDLVLTDPDGAELAPLLVGTFDVVAAVTV
jgi:hypothetical protein